jgi:ferric-dicitrate binding protein FerR (iron transport regulator)
MLSEGNTERSPSADIAPGTNKAILSIGTNKTIDLSANKTGINVNKTITYNDGEKIAEADQMLVLTTPRGGQYQAILPDGTKVWLNAESSIRFPSKFDGAERRIELTGEVYLEIAQDKSKPFFVTSKNTNIQVLGTSFNVNSYTNEPATKTTLLEGSIRIDDKILNPGEAYTKGKIIKATIAQDIAWKNGLFNFDGADLHSVMRQLERWYNISVEYRGNINNEIFKGQLSRDLTLAQLTRILEEMDIKFIIDGRKLIVTQ